MSHHRSFLAVLALLTAALLGGGQARANPAAYSGWFSYGSEQAEDWQFAAVPGDANQVIVRPAGSSGGAKRRVFVLYPRPSSAYDVAITKILDVFAEKNIDVEFRVVNFGNKDDAGQAALKQAEAGKFELIFSMGSESTAWLWQHYRGGRLPVVSVCSKDPVQLGQAPDYETGSGNNFAFTSLNVPVEVQMAYVLQLKPRLRNLGILVDEKNVSAMQTQAEPVAKYARQRGIQVLQVGVQNPQNARQELDRLVPAAVATMRKSDPDLGESVFWITGSTAVFKEIQTINSHADRVPVLSAIPEVVTAGDDSAALSIGVSFESNAHLAAIYGADVLAGKVKAGDLKVGVVSPPDIAINHRKTRQIGLRVPFSFFESASFVYDYDGRLVRANGKPVAGN